MLEDVKVVIRNRQYKKERQNNGKKTKGETKHYTENDERINNNKFNTIIRLHWIQWRILTCEATTFDCHWKHMERQVVNKMSHITYCVNIDCLCILKNKNVRHLIEFTRLSDTLKIKRLNSQIY